MLPGLALLPTTGPGISHTQVWASGRLSTIPNPGSKPVRVKRRAEFLLLAPDNGTSEES